MNLLFPTIKWRHLPRMLGVAYIHNAGYLGGFVGLVVALVFLLFAKRASKAGGAGE
ncbi:MAG: hypothetical protein PHQ12_04045 [Chthoniobacteraceae bacterium]|nr:hypothetical protein [Chthoniobacteraceae bacterium]